MVGSGITAGRLSPSDVGLQLAENATATGAALAVIILLVGPISGGHLNPLVSLADWWLGHARRTGLAVVVPPANGPAPAVKLSADRHR